MVLASYDCDELFFVPGFYIPFTGGGSGNSNINGMFSISIQAGAQGMAPYLGAYNSYDCDGSEHSQLEHILPFLGGAGRSCDYAGHFSIQFARTASFFGSYHGACLIYFSI